MTCESCNCVMDELYSRSAMGRYYCESCFEDIFTYCEDCDEVINRDDACYDDDIPYCESCYGDKYDDDAPENPHVDDDDRSAILTLSRKWLFAKELFPQININKDDSYLDDIRDSIGRVRNSVYVYGLTDDHNFQIRTTGDLHTKVSRYLADSVRTDITVNLEDGVRKIGIARDLRANQQSLIVDMLKEVLVCAE